MDEVVLTEEEVQAELAQRAEAGTLLPACHLHYHQTKILNRRMNRIEGILIGNGAVGLDETVRNTHRDHKFTRKWIYAIAAYTVVANPTAVTDFVQTAMQYLK